MARPALPAAINHPAMPIKNVSCLKFLLQFRPLTGHRQIVYVSLIAPLFLAAFLEWILWILAFDYCLYCCIKKASDWTTRIMALLVMVLFTCLR